MTEPILIPEWRRASAPQVQEDVKHLARVKEMDALLADDPEMWKLESARLAKTDLVWLLAEILSTRLWRHPERKDVRLFRHPWVIEMVQSIQDAPSDTLKILSRGHVKTSTLFGKIIQTFLSNPDATIGLYAITSDLAKASVQMVMSECENNELLISLCPDVLYADPKNESPRWGIATGIQVKRRLNLRDPTLKPYGLLDSTFTGARQTHQFYDDCVNEKVVTTAAMVAKANRQWGLSLNLGMPNTYRGYFGTFYGVGDSYHYMIEHGVTLDFTSCYKILPTSKFSSSGIPIRLEVDRNAPNLYTAEYLARQEERMGKSMFAVQMLGIPSAQDVTDFNPEWFLTYETPPERAAKGMNLLILCDPANAVNAASSTSKERHSFTAMGVFGLAEDRNYYLLDGIRDRLNLAQRMDALFGLHRKWSDIGHVLETRYEQSGMSSDIEALRLRMEHENYRFIIIPVSPQGIPKLKRIERLIPIARAGRLLVPAKGIHRITVDGRRYNVVQEWLEQEIYPYPGAVHLDFSDMASRIEEPGVYNTWPARKVKRDGFRDAFYEKEKSKTTWMSN